MSKAIVQSVDLPKSMAEFAQLQAPQIEVLKQTRLHIEIKKLWWKVSKVLWKTKDPLRYMCAVAELVIKTYCGEQTHKAGDVVFTSHNASSLTKGFGSMLDNMTKDRGFKNNPILTPGREMSIAHFLLDETVYVNAAAHMNFHAVCLWILGRFALAETSAMPETSATLNKEVVQFMCPTWTAYLESILQARLQKGRP